MVKTSATGGRGVRTAIGCGLALSAVFVVNLPSAAFAAAPVPRHVVPADPTLRVGMTGAGVVQLQTLLHMPTVTGFFGPLTKQAVRSFQDSHGLRPSGVANARTWRTLKNSQHANPPVSATRSPVLGAQRGVGKIAAPIRRFTDGGHAYYLYGKGLHSCRYTGRCMDLFAGTGEPVYAFADGVASIPPYAGHSFGKHVVITHRDGTQTLYAHLSSISTKPGPVRAGTPIGRVGCSGTSGEQNSCARSAAHLHFEWSGLMWRGFGDPGQTPPYFSRWR